MFRCSLLIVFALLPAAVRADEANQPAEERETPFVARLRIAFSSYRRSPRQPKVYFYEHDGVSQGRIAGTIETGNKQSDTHASLSADGRLCAIAHEAENQVSQIFVWDAGAEKFLDLPQLNDTPHAQLWPTLSADGRRLVLAAWNRPGASPRWDLVHYDLEKKAFAELPGVNTPQHDERMPALSRDGRLLAYTTNAPDGAGLVDVVLVEVQTGRRIELPNLNSSGRDVDPALDAAGRLVVFSSDRPGGAGGRDIYLYDREAGGFVPLPGLNSVANEQSPALSADGRYLAFVSERIRGAGQRDVYLYDRRAGKLLPTPDLNAAEEDIDPFVLSLAEE